MKLYVLAVVCIPILALGAMQQTTYPDVERFIAKRNDCDHARGEIPDTPDKALIDEAIKDINTLCKGTDAKLRALKRKYRANSAVMKKLRRFESGIEATP